MQINYFLIILLLTGILLEVLHIGDSGMDTHSSLFKRIFSGIAWH